MSVFKAIKNHQILLSKMSFAKRLIIFLLWSAFTMYIMLNITHTHEPPERVKIHLTNTDTIYRQIYSLEVVSDTIKLYYEKKIKNYNTLSTPKRVKLFADRINR